MAAIQKTELDDVIAFLSGAANEARGLILEDLKDKPQQRPISGEITCPLCLDTLDYVQTTNGHIHGICRTSGCLGFNK